RLLALSALLAGFLRLARRLLRRPVALIARLTRVILGLLFGAGVVGRIWLFARFWIAALGIAALGAGFGLIVCAFGFGLPVALFFVLLEPFLLGRIGWLRLLLRVVALLLGPVLVVDLLVLLLIVVLGLLLGLAALLFLLCLVLLRLLYGDLERLAAADVAIRI